MRIGIAVGIVATILVFGYLYNYRQRMTRPISATEHRELIHRTLSNHVKMSESESLPYRLFAPNSVNDTTPLPLVLYLHGAGGRGTDNAEQLDIIVDLLTSKSHQDAYRSYVMAPQCPKGRQWVDLKNESPPYLNYDQNAIPESEYLTMVRKALDEIKKTHNVDLNRIYAIGFSMGATGTWDLITRYPDMFAAALILNGRSDPTKAARIKNIPLAVYHGKFDRISPIENAREMISQLSSFDGNVIFKELFWGHGIPRVVFEKHKPFMWLFKQKKAI